MQIPGIDTILFKGAEVIWPGESNPSSDLAGWIDELPHKLRLGRIDEARKMLDNITRSELEPSQTMRLHFLQAQLFSDLQDYGQALQFYRHALDVAEEHEDLDSRITLTNCRGLMMYGMMRHREAIEFYQQALALWQVRAAQIERPRAEPEVTLRERIGSEQWYVGDFDAAQAMLARALILALYRHGIPHTDYLRETTAFALWSLALVLRSQSDMSDGRVNLLQMALKRMRSAVRRFEIIGADDANMGRLYVQIAEIHLDLAELYLLEDNDKEAQRMRRLALKRAQQAADFLKHTDSAAGKLLPELTLLRYEITQRLDREALLQMPEFEARLIRIEHAAAEIGDAVISAKAATLRGEWCLWLGDPTPAREVLLLALVGLQHNNMGMATRAQRLLRRANAPAQDSAHRRAPDGPAAPSAQDEQP